MRNSRQNHARNIRDAVEMNSPTYNELVWNVLDREYGPFKYAEKLLARHARATPKAARNWLDRQCAPNGENLMNLMAQCETLAEEINRLIAERKAARGET